MRRRLTCIPAGCALPDKFNRPGPSNHLIATRRSRLQVSQRAESIASGSRALGGQPAPRPKGANDEFRRTCLHPFGQKAAGTLR